VAVALTLVQKKQIRINIHKRNKIKNTVQTIQNTPKHPHIHTTTRTHTHTQTLICILKYSIFWAHTHASKHDVFVCLV